MRFSKKSLPNQTVVLVTFDYIHVSFLYVRWPFEYCSWQLAYLFFWGRLLWKWEVPRNGEELTKGLKLLGLKPGPLGYFNSFYMAFTKAEADRFPNLVSYHSMLRRMKIYNITRESQVLLHSNRSRLRRGESSDSDSTDGSTGPSFPVTEPRGFVSLKQKGFVTFVQLQLDLDLIRDPSLLTWWCVEGSSPVDKVPWEASAKILPWLKRSYRE